MNHNANKRQQILATLYQFREKQCELENPNYWMSIVDLKMENKGISFFTDVLKELGFIEQNSGFPEVRITATGVLACEKEWRDCIVNEFLEAF